MVAVFAAAALSLVALEAPALFLAAEAALRAASFFAASTMAAWRILMQAAFADKHLASGVQTFSVYGILKTPKTMYLVVGLQIGTQGFGVQGRDVSSSASRSSSRVMSESNGATSAAMAVMARARRRNFIIGF